MLYPVSAESDAKRTSADMEKGETGKETMDLFPQIAGFGSEAATKEAPDARYTSLFCWVSVHSHSHVMLAWYYCCSQLMTENVKKKQSTCCEKQLLVASFLFVKQLCLRLM